MQSQLENSRIDCPPNLASENGNHEASSNDIQSRQIRRLSEREDESSDTLEPRCAKRRCDRTAHDVPFPSPEDALCEKCEMIDLDRLFKMRVRRKRNLVGELVAPLEALGSSSRRSSCPLCRLVATVRINELKCTSTTENSSKYFLRAVYSGSYLQSYAI
ncbi:hypothetical protein NA56DRAFT_753122 [Hyaloscypha hepaticicola]|uniref:Uncharacterized protein n=1 Tax=Hyaloscypha hepaticicola TaxID=2082293 RepID=A0A2J6PRD2_9HELO|nr:hypothetical protein NA56DRAFT_753122 [Hyaloscypha hepaticicola]